MSAAPLPRPRSEAQRSASRLNGARSRGPVTAEGRARASRNALRHGLRAATLLAPGEDPAAFEALLDGLRTEYAPADATRELLVERLAATLWKLRRCDRLEAELAACPPRPPAGRVYPDGTPVLLTRSAELSVLSAHAARLERALHRLLAALAGRPAPDRRTAAPRPGAPTGRDSRLGQAAMEVPTGGSDDTVAPSSGHCRDTGSADEPEPPAAVSSPTGRPTDDVPTVARATDTAPLGRATPEPIRTNEPEPSATPPDPAARADAGAGACKAEIPVRGSEAGPVPQENEFRANGPDAAATRGATPSGPPIGVGPHARGRVPGPTPSGGEQWGPQAAERAADGATPDPEARLLARARTDPLLALAMAERLAAQGELARLRRLLAGLGPGARTGQISLFGPARPETTRGSRGA